MRNPKHEWDVVEISAERGGGGGDLCSNTEESMWMPVQQRNSTFAITNRIYCNGETQILISTIQRNTVRWTE